LKRILSFILVCLSCYTSYAQKKPAHVSGRIVDENEAPLAGVSVSILGRTAGFAASDSGAFTLKVPSGKAFALVFTCTGYTPVQRNFFLSENEEERIVIRMAKRSTQLPGVIVTDDRERREAGLIRINPKDALNLPAPTGGVESLIKVFVGSNNELTSQYAVRGGNYDENLIYVNDFEVFRPYLVSNAQQEGLSFINPEMAKNVSFYEGGFQARYGDKMSSVLDIQYKKPERFGGSAYVSLLEQGLQLEGSSKEERFTWLVGARNRTNQSLFASQETKGNYVPAASDIQAVLGYQINAKNSLEAIGTFSRTRFNLVPQYSQLSAAIFTPYFTEDLALDINFTGREKDAYQSSLLGMALTQQVNPRFRMKWMLSYFRDSENETNDITGSYVFGERDFDKNSSTYGLIINPLGAGTNQTYVRDQLGIGVWSAANKGSFELGKHYVQWGAALESQAVDSKLHEWERQDSAGYTLPYDPDTLRLSSLVNGNASLHIGRFQGFLQDNVLVSHTKDFTVQAGVRYNFNTLNHQFLLSPRAGISWKPVKSRRDIVYRAAAGIYDQPPFYREMVRPDGSLNTSLKAQRSWQVTGGFDYNFKFSGRPFRLSTEAYYKGMSDVVPYDLNNVHIQYFGENVAKAYAAGIETRLFGDLVKGAESWISLGFMRTREKIKNAFYYNYQLDSLNRPVDTTRVEQGWVRRPTDRLFTLGMFIQDYLPTNKNFKVYLNLLYGSNLAYNIPGSVKYRGALIIDPYIRVDAGFSVLLLDPERTTRRLHSPFREFQSIWATLEVFNVIDRENTISYYLVKDFSNTVYAMPQRLTPRLINLKLAARF
jgi:hypothetical protein